MRTIAHITDIHLDEGLLEDLGVNTERNWRRILKDVAARGIHDVVFGGDIGAPTSYSWFFNTVKHFSFRYVVGNHDDVDDAERYFDGHSDGNEELYYALEEDGYKQVFMDTSSEHVSDAQLQWLTQQINTDRPILLYIHHPVLGIDTPIDRKYPLHGRDQVKKALLSNLGPVTIFCGHYHMDDMQQVGNITQYVTPAASYQIAKEAGGIEKDNGKFGYRIVRIDEKNIQTELVMFDA
ncbi:metallophosphoesterase family protein [Mucilaginibacter myungsuensis]|uniref:Metallophosphoesterase family protein n=1 Tax=Mucilaginibacter myungsuensis TaxID=649104 RepID=A0A929L1P9_9SPHI|nr:metallophosphoesterase [Mucilaginibacter myungsuensis]MBE9663998.1 metallophosphoesterase family protein [Mucilaginibacter myungsuensis]MDN3601177.1 metallophosphoesterase family protein [Mucilaginibacter myungsuensis]